MLIRIVRMTFAPDKVEDFRNIFEESKDKIRAREGCLHLELWRDWHQDNVFVTSQPLGIGRSFKCLPGI